MVATRTLLFLVLASTAALVASKPAAEKPQKAAETPKGAAPLITAALFTDTYNLFFGFYEMGWDLIESRVQRFETGFVVAGVGMYWPYHGAVELAKKTGKHSEFQQAEKQLSTLKLTLTAHAASIWDAATARGNKVAEFVVSKFEAAMPKHKGLIPINLLDFSVFILYISFVLYVLLKLVRCILSMFFGIFCCICCCGCCRRGSNAKAVGKETKAKEAAGKASKAGKTSGAKK